MPSTPNVYRFFLHNPDGSLFRKPYSVGFGGLGGAHIRAKLWKAEVPGRYFKIVRNGKPWFDSRDA